MRKSKIKNLAEVKSSCWEMLHHLLPAAWLSPLHSSLVLPEDHPCYMGDHPCTALPTLAVDQASLHLAGTGNGPRKSKNATWHHQTTWSFPKADCRRGAETPCFKHLHYQKTSRVSQAFITTPQPVQLSESAVQRDRVLCGTRYTDNPP